MHKQTQKKIPCTVAFLTWNSEVGLRRTLESVKDFAEIIFIDGGSTDETLNIAKEYGVKVVSQSNPGNPITDFGKERQIGLDASFYDWHLWLDSDDVISPELSTRIREIVYDHDHEVVEYWVRQKRVRHSDLKEYKTSLTSYQPRLIKKTRNARFGRIMHERVLFDGEVNKGYIQEPWLVLLGEDKFNFSCFKEKAWYRAPALIAASNKPLTITRFLRMGIVHPGVSVIKRTIRMILNKIMYGKEAMPIRYDLFKMYYIWVNVRVYWRIYFKKLFCKVQK